MMDLMFIIGIVQTVCLLVIISQLKRRKNDGD
jgi:hypothetical protein